MATTTEVLTGSTDNAPVDGVTRGVVVAAVNAIVAFAALELDINADRLAVLNPAITLLGFLLWGLYDGFARGKVTSRGAPPI